METLKVALVSDWFYPKIGGIETHIHELSLSLLKLGHEPHVITHDYRGWRGRWGRGRLPYPVHRFRGSIYLGRLHVSVGPGMLYSINRLYKGIGFDVTHVHSLYSPLGMSVAQLSRGIRSVPVVATHHSLLPRSAAGRAAARLLISPLVKRVDIIIAVSNAVRRDTAALLGGHVDEKEIIVVPNAIDPGFWRPSEPGERANARKALGVAGDEVVVTVVGRLTRRKEIHHMPRIAREAWERAGAGKRVILLIVGDGPERKRVEAAAEAASKPPGFRVLVMGFKPRSLLREVYWASDILVVPSAYEAFSITALEALACGVPVVGRRGSGVEDLVNVTGGGLLADSTEELISAIAQLLVDEGLRARLAATAVKRVQSHYSWDRVAPRIVEVYRRAMHRASLVDREFLLHRLWLRVSKL